MYRSIHFISGVASFSLAVRDFGVSPWDVTVGEINRYTLTRLISVVDDDDDDNVEAEDEDVRQLENRSSSVYP